MQQITLPRIDQSQSWKQFDVFDSVSQQAFTLLTKMAALFTASFSDDVVTISQPPVCGTSDRDRYIYRVRLFGWLSESINSVSSLFGLEDMIVDDDNDSPVPMISLWQPEELLLYDKRLNANLDGVEGQLNLLIHLFKIYEFNL